MSKISKSFFISACCFPLITGIAQAQPSRSLSLEEAIQLSLDNSKQLKIADAAIQEAVADVSMSENNVLPDINVTGAYMRLNHANVDLKVPLGKDNSSGSESPSPIEVNQAAYGMANLSLPLFYGFRIHNGIRSARYLQKAAELDADQDRDEAIQNTIAAYYNLYKAQAAVSLVEENLKQAKQRVSDFSNMEQNGLLARNDLLKAQLLESNVELALLDAQNNAKTANFNMDLMLGLDKNTVLSLDTVSAGAPVEIKSLEAWEALALAHRNDYQAVQQRQEAAASGIKAAKGGYFPSLALTGGYVAAYVPKVLTVTNALNVGLGLHYNLADLYKNGAKVKKAEARQQQVYFAGLQLNDHIRMQMHDAFQDYVESLKKIKVYEKAVEQANENYRITKNKYDNSLATTTDLLEADVSQLQASLNYQFSKADAMIAYNKLYETAGLLSEHLKELQK
jgi:outer membrane protein TolC